MFQPSCKGLPSRPRAVSLGTKDEAAALEKAVEMMGAGFADRADSQPVAVWAGVYVRDREDGGHYRPQTLRQVEHCLGVLVQTMGWKDPDEVTRAEAVGWFQAVGARGVSHSTAHRYVRYARAFFSWLEEREAVKANPFKGLHLPTPTQSRRDEFLTAEERDRMIGLCGREDMRFVLHAGFFLGLRIGEIGQARFGWFRTGGGAGRGFCVVKHAEGWESKTRRERQVPISRRFGEYWDGVEKGEADEFVLRLAEGQGKGDVRWYPKKAWKVLAEAAGVPWATFHSMRHTFGSLHAMAGTPELKIRRWMGITQATFERHYAGLLSEDPDADRV